VKHIDDDTIRAGRGWRALGMGAALALAMGLSTQAQPPGFPGGHEGPGGHGGGMGMGMDFNPRMLRELHLAPDQERKLKEDRLAFQKKKIQLYGEKAALELDLKNIFSTYPVKRADALKLADKIADVEKRLTILRVDGMAQLLGGLTAEQHSKLIDLQDEWMEKRKAWREEMDKDRKSFRDHRDGKDKDGKGEEN
jgi:Spy/CpxP family protein refolding chaperone